MWTIHVIIKRDPCWEVLLTEIIMTVLLLYIKSEVVLEWINYASFKRETWEIIIWIIIIFCIIKAITFFLSLILKLKNINFWILLWLTTKTCCSCETYLSYKSSKYHLLSQLVDTVPDGGEVLGSGSSVFVSTFVSIDTHYGTGTTPGM